MGSQLRNTCAGKLGIRWRMKSQGQPQTPKANDSRPIHVQSNDGCTPRRRSAEDSRIVVAPGEVARPDLTSRVEPRDTTTGIGIERRRLRRFCIVAKRAGETEILGVRGATFNTRHDMVDLKRFGAQRLSRLTILTAKFRPTQYQLSQPARDVCCRTHVPMATPTPSIRRFAAQQRPGQLQHVAFRLIDQSVQLTPLGHRQRILAVLVQQFRQPILFCRVHAEVVANAASRFQRLLRGGKRRNSLKQLQPLGHGQLFNCLVDLFKRQINSCHCRVHRAGKRLAPTCLSYSTQTMCNNRASSRRNCKS